MTSPLSRKSRPGRAALSLRWLVLAVILFGTIISSLGVMNSHGLAAIAELSHVAPASSDTEEDHAHGHTHEEGDDEWGMGGHGSSADHPHHGADHSHDKAHALPAAWHTAAPVLPVWFGQAMLLIEMVEASRLERPPMG